MKPMLQAAQISGGYDERVRILLSKQTVDIRMGERDVAIGPMVLFDHKVPFVVMVDVVYFRYCPLREVTMDELLADNYNTHEQALADLTGYYSDATMDSTVTVIKYANVRGLWVDDISNFHWLNSRYWGNGLD